MSRSPRARTRGAPRTGGAANGHRVEMPRAPTIAREVELLKNPPRGGRDDDSSASEEDDAHHFVPNRERAAPRVVRQNLQGWLNTQLDDKMEHLTIGGRKKVTKPSFEKYGVELATSTFGIQLVLYQTRHSGASRDAKEMRRTGAEIQKKGDWRSAKSVNRCEKSGRLSAAWDSLTPALQHHALRCEAGLWETVAYGRVTVA